MFFTIGLVGCQATPSTDSSSSYKDFLSASAKKQKSVEERAQELFVSGNEAIKKKHFQEAEQLFLTLNQEYPEYSGSLVNLGIIYSEQKQWQKAEDMFLRAAGINSENVLAYNQLGYVYRNMGRLEEAEKSYKKAIRMWPDYPAAWLNLGILYELYLNKLDESLKAYEKFQSISDTPDETVALWIDDLKARLEKNKLVNSNE